MHRKAPGHRKAGRLVLQALKLTHAQNKHVLQALKLTDVTYSLSLVASLCQIMKRHYAASALQCFFLSSYTVPDSTLHCTALPTESVLFT